jgi:hypothetical protein
MSYNLKQKLINSEQPELNNKEVNELVNLLFDQMRAYDPAW